MLDILYIRILFLACSMCLIDAAAWFLHRDGGEHDVPVDLQSGDGVQGAEAVLVRVSLHPIHHHPKVVTFTADGQLKEEHRQEVTTVTIRVGTEHQHSKFRGHMDTLLSALK